ncbi:MAG: hypothetical protein ACLPYZ_16370 [Limisphaerales bacterium]
MRFFAAIDSTWRAEGGGWEVKNNFVQRMHEENLASPFGPAKEKKANPDDSIPAAVSCLDQSDLTAVQ